MSELTNPFQGELENKLPLRSPYRLQSQSQSQPHSQNQNSLLDNDAGKFSTVVHPSPGSRPSYASSRGSIAMKHQSAIHHMDEYENERVLDDNESDFSFLTGTHTNDDHSTYSLRNSISRQMHPPAIPPYFTPPANENDQDVFGSRITSYSSMRQMSSPLNALNESLQNMHSGETERPLRDSDSDYPNGSSVFDEKSSTIMYNAAFNHDMAHHGSGMETNGTNLHISSGGGGSGGGSGAVNDQSLWKRKKKTLILLVLLIVVVILAAVLVPVGLLLAKKNTPQSTSSDSSSSPASPSATNSIPADAAGTVLDPSTWMDHRDFNLTYTNATVGGLSVMGLNSTWNDSAQPNPDVPPLNQPFAYGDMPMRGVNLGGWLILEPFITPSLFSNFTESQGIVDEYTFSTYMNSTSGPSGLKTVLETHYMSFVTEDTFQEIAQAGLDHVRIPYPYWAVKVYPGDPYLPQVSWRYLLRAIEYARKYGIRVNVDFHALPGSQNGWNHSGRQGYPHWLNGTQGLVYGNESLALHQQLAQFFAQDRYKNIVTFYGLVNEPKMQSLNDTLVIEWTGQAYDIVRQEGFQNNIVFGDGFLGEQAWAGVFNETRYPNMTLDLHQYTIFDNNLIQMSHDAKLNFVCQNWASVMGASMNPATGHGPTMVGEWSQADNDCTLYLNNVDVGSRWEGSFNPGYNTAPVLTPSCPGAANCTCVPSNQDPSTYSDEYKAFLLQFAETQMEIFEQGWGFMYWTWDTETGQSSQWSYKQARAAGTLPQVVYERSFNCSSQFPQYVQLGLPENY